MAQLAFAHSNVSALTLAAQLPPLSLPSSSSTSLPLALSTAAATATLATTFSAVASSTSSASSASSSASASRTHIPASEYLARGTAIAHQLLRLRASAAVVRLDGSHAPASSAAASQVSSEKFAMEKSAAEKSAAEKSSAPDAALLPASVRAQVESSHGAVRRLELEARQLLRSAAVAVPTSASAVAHELTAASSCGPHASRVVAASQPPKDERRRLMGRLSLPALHTAQMAVFGDEQADAAPRTGGGGGGCGAVGSRAVAMRPMDLARLHSAVAF